MIIMILLKVYQFKLIINYFIFYFIIQFNIHSLLITHNPLGLKHHQFIDHNQFNPTLILLIIYFKFPIITIKIITFRLLEE